ncbi:MAG: DUF533 domain-containing protein [Pseudomonadota bacterium]
MSLMKTLAKVTVGVALAKGASSMMKNRKGGAGGGTGSGLGGLLGGARGGGSGNLQSMIGGLLGGTGGGGLGGLLAGLGGARGASGTGQGSGQLNPSFGTVLNSQFDETPDAPMDPTADQEAQAALMLRAMIQAAKADGQIDAAEEEKLMGHVGDDLTDEDIAFLNAEMAKDPDPAALAREVPQGLEEQVYAVSVLAIDLDNRAEAEHLHALAQGLSLPADRINAIHGELGVPPLYT